MYQAPEVEHLQRAVDAVKRQVSTRKKTEPEIEPDADETTERETEGGSGE
jgi:hypothetical protein